MYAYIKSNLIRQQKGLAVLLELLREEFSHLQNRDPHAVTQNEFALHELVRQLAAERDEIVQALSGKRLTSFLVDMNPEKCPPGMEYLLEETEEARDRQAELGSLLASIDATEQECVRQGERNARLASALLEQNSEMVEFLHKQIQPKNTNTYSRQGGYAKIKPTASILQGRL